MLCTRLPSTSLPFFCLLLLSPRAPCSRMASTTFYSVYSHFIVSVFFPAPPFVELHHSLTLLFFRFSLFCSCFIWISETVRGKGSNLKCSFLFTVRIAILPSPLQIYMPSYFGTSCERACEHASVPVRECVRCSCHMMRVLVNAECVCVRVRVYMRVCLSSAKSIFANKKFRFIFCVTESRIFTIFFSRSPFLDLDSLHATFHSHHSAVIVVVFSLSLAVLKIFIALSLLFVYAFDPVLFSILFLNMHVFLILLVGSEERMRRRNEHGLRRLFFAFFHFIHIHTFIFPFFLFILFDCGLVPPPPPPLLLQ